MGKVIDDEVCAGVGECVGIMVAGGHGECSAAGVFGASNIVDGVADDDDLGWGDWVGVGLVVVVDGDGWEM